VTSTRESLGKAGSLKKNYGAVTTEKIRNRAAVEKPRAALAEAHRAGPGRLGR
jgi:hypothetical protein